MYAFLHRFDSKDLIHVAWSDLESDQAESEVNTKFKKIKHENAFNCFQLEKGFSPDDFLTGDDFVLEGSKIKDA